MLRLPYDILNRLNRLLLFQKQKDRCQSFSVADYYLTDSLDNCFDFFVVAGKPYEIQPSLSILDYIKIGSNEKVA
jgi:hypothetical protein